jgi:hypothetical protein
MLTTPSITPLERHRLYHQLTVEARRQQRHNPYALAHYLEAMERVEMRVAAGVSLCDALAASYDGPIVGRLLRAVHGRQGAQDDAREEGRK